MMAATCAGVVSGGNIAHSRVNSVGVVHNRRLDHRKAAFDLGRRR